MKNITRCNVRSKEKSCLNDIVIEIKVTLYHPNSDRKSNQNWFLCEEHLTNFLRTNGQGWYKWYNNRESISPLIDFEIISCSEHTSSNTLRQISKIIDSNEKMNNNVILWRR